MKKEREKQSDQEQDAPENFVQNDPAFYVKDLLVLTSMLTSKAKTISAIEFSQMQKAIIAGAFQQYAVSLNVFMAKLKEWGFMS